MAPRGRLPRRSALPHTRTCADVPDPHVDCAGMPWGHRRCPSTAASITEDHLAEGGCCVDRRLIVVSFLCFPARPDVPAARPGPVDVVEPRDGLDVEVVEAGLVGSNAAGPRKSENRDPALCSANYPRPRFAYPPLLPLEAVGHGVAGFRCRQGQGGGATRPCLSFSFWRALDVLFVLSLEVISFPL